MSSFESYISSNSNVSVGIHPYDSGREDVDKKLDELVLLASKGEVLAIGECGLDKTIDVPLERQLEVFKAQIELSELYKKPIVIHDVKAHQEILMALRGFSFPVIIHGVNNKWTAIDKFVEKGFYLSYGKSLLNNNISTLQTFIQTPLNQIFLETDDADIDIKVVYQKAAEIKQISVEQLKLQIQNNFQDVFNKNNI